MKNKKIYMMSALLVSTLLVLTLLTSCSRKDYSGTYVGYSWKDEVNGVTLDEATQKIQTTLTLDEKAVITDAKISFLVKDSDGNWVKREDPSATVSVDFSVSPSNATLPDGDIEYSDGNSMFDIETVDMMAFYAVAVNEEGTVALTIVEPYTRLQFEYKFESDFDFATPMKELTIGSGLAVPTIITSSAANIKPTNWDELSDASILDFHPDDDAYVLVGRGVFDGLTEESAISEYLVKAGVNFENEIPQPLEAKHGFTGTGGWSGNYESIRNFLIGNNARVLLSLVNWDIPRYGDGINDDGFFGVDDVAGATKTVQGSFDGISGATVRVSRESTSYQRALVEAGILEEDEVIKGRF